MRYYLQKENVQRFILDQGKRLDGRAIETVRPISERSWEFCQQAHWLQPIFARGETQAVTLTTLGTSEDAQEFDSYTGGSNEKKFILPL